MINVLANNAMSISILKMHLTVRRILPKNLFYCMRSQWRSDQSVHLCCLTGFFVSMWGFCRLYPFFQIDFELMYRIDLYCHGRRIWRTGFLAVWLLQKWHLIIFSCFYFFQIIVFISVMIISVCWTDHSFVTTCTIAVTGQMNTTVPASPKAQDPRSVSNNVV